MQYIIVGMVAFVLFFIYDINSVVMKYKILKHSFFIGILLLLISTIAIVVDQFEYVEFNIVKFTALGTATVLFFILLIYTLFFAIPFQETYIESESKQKLYMDGVYALCRHPGVIWFIGLYVSLSFAFDIPLLKIAAIIFSILNIIYSAFQDSWTFNKVFDDYDKYKENTPFLLPNVKSIKKCLHSLYWGRYLQ